MKDFEGNWRLPGLHCGEFAGGQRLSVSYRWFEGFDVLVFMYRCRIRAYMPEKGMRAGAGWVVAA